jgi:hypothetical protein
MPADVNLSTGTSSEMTWTDGPLRHRRKHADIHAPDSRAYSPSFALIRMCRFRHDLNSLLQVKPEHPRTRSRIVASIRVIEVEWVEYRRTGDDSLCENAK